MMIISGNTRENLMSQLDLEEINEKLDGDVQKGAITGFANRVFDGEVACLGS
jgi:hypothetical protein